MRIQVEGELELAPVERGEREALSNRDAHPTLRIADRREVRAGFAQGFSGALPCRSGWYFRISRRYDDFTCSNVAPYGSSSRS